MNYEYSLPVLPVVGVQLSATTRIITGLCLERKLENV